MTKVMKLTHETLTELLDFDPATGVFTWKVSRSNRVKPGSRAGVVHKPSGGRYISIGDEKIMSHKLAWFYVHKSWSELEIRPVDGDYDHCAINNLKEVSRVELSHARTKQENNTSGFLGVSKTAKGKWQASLTWNYKQISLGANFDTPEAASEVREEAKRRLLSETDQDGFNRVMEELRVWKGQKTAWRFLNRDHSSHAWNSFEAFCSDVKDVPVMRYSMVPLDATAPIGPGNFDWTFPPDATRTTPEGIVAHNKARKERQGDVIRDREFRRKYGIGFPAYQQMLLDQKGVCAICEKPETKIENGTIRLLSVDHNHTTGAVRGLLCANCNLAIGYTCDDVTVLQKAIGYLRKHAGVETVLSFEPTRPDRDWLMVATPGFKE